jgi:hypothetical protein
MTAAVLTKYGLALVARVHIADRKFIIEITDPETVKLEKCIYAFLIGGEIVRVGSSKAPLKSRLRNYELHITHALNGRRSPTPDQEAVRWSEILPDGRLGDIYARQGTMVTTPLGTFPAYMDEESLLIGKLFKEFPHNHILNRNKHR